MRQIKLEAPDDVELVEIDLDLRSGDGIALAYRDFDKSWITWSCSKVSGTSWMLINGHYDMDEETARADFLRRHELILTSATRYPH